MSESATIAPTGFEHLLGLASQAAGEDLAASIAVSYTHLTLPTIAKV